MAFKEIILEFSMDKVLVEPSLTLIFVSLRNIVLAIGCFLETRLENVGKCHISEEYASIFLREMYGC